MVMQIDEPNQRFFGNQFLFERRRKFLRRLFGMSKIEIRGKEKFKEIDVNVDICSNCSIVQDVLY
jgi:hypothetical protein